MSTNLSALIANIQRLDELELALLLSRTANEHCIVEVPQQNLNTTEERIKLIASELFGLSSVSVTCSETTTVDDFGISVLMQTPLSNELVSSQHSRVAKPTNLGLANVVVAKNLSAASYQVQIQALELLRIGRIFTHTDVYAAPRPFLFIALNPLSGPRLSSHLNDFFFMSTSPVVDDPEIYDEYHYDETKGKTVSDTLNETEGDEDRAAATISTEDIECLTRLRQEVVMTTEVRRYLHDVLIFLRMNRAVASGASPRATKHFELLSRCLAPCNGLAFVPPSLVGLAARKVFRHRLKLVSVPEERSMQYGSDPTLVATFLKGLTPELVIDEVLEGIEVPV